MDEASRTRGARRRPDDAPAPLPGTLARGAARRAAILRMLQERREPQPIAAIAEEVGLGASAVREHLDGLVAAGLVRRESERSGARGRPRMLFAPADAALVGLSVTDVRERVLHILLDGYGLSGADALAYAERAGEEWGEGAVDHCVSGRDALVSALAGLMAALGNDPVVVPGESRMELGSCPLSDVALEHPEIVCRIHLGVLRGFSRAVCDCGPDVTLEPFAQNGRCAVLIVMPESAEEPELPDASATV